MRLSAAMDPVARLDREPTDGHPNPKCNKRAQEVLNTFRGGHSPFTWQILQGCSRAWRYCEGRGLP